MSTEDQGSLNLAHRNKKSHPPAFTTDGDYQFWKKELAFWQEYTDLKDTEQGFAILFRLEDKKAKEAATNLGIDAVKSPEGVNQIIECLDELYEKDKDQSMYEAYEYFENFRRPSKMGITRS